MVKTEEYDNIRREIVYVTTREWIAPNGHKVTVVSRNTRRDGTILSNINYHSSTTYTCECGLNHRTWRNAQKAMLLEHDSSWMTNEQREESAARLMALLG